MNLNEEKRRYDYRAQGEQQQQIGIQNGGSSAFSAASPRLNFDLQRSGTGGFVVGGDISGSGGSGVNFPYYSGGVGSSIGGGVNGVSSMYDQSQSLSQSKSMGVVGLQDPSYGLHVGNGRYDQSSGMHSGLGSWNSGLGGSGGQLRSNNVGNGNNQSGMMMDSGNYSQQISSSRSSGSIFQPQHQQHQQHQQQQIVGSSSPNDWGLSGSNRGGMQHMSHQSLDPSFVGVGGVSQMHLQGSGFGLGDMQSLQQQQQQHQYNSGGNGQQMIIQQQIGPPQRSPRQYTSSPSGTIISTAGNGRNYPSAGTGGSNAQGRALNKMLLEILRERVVEPNRLAMAIDANIERMDCVNLATLLFHTGKKRLLLTPSFIKRIAGRFNLLKEELRAREASNALYGLKCMSSECVEVRQLVFALANKVSASTTELVAQAVGNALYGCQMMTSDHEEVRYLLQVLAIKVGQCSEPLEAQNVGNALYGLRGMSSDCKEVRALLAALTPKVATAREDLNGQALGNSLYGMQGMSSREVEVRSMLNVLATKAARTWEDLKAQEVGNALYGLKRVNSDIPEVRILIDALVPKIASSPEILDAQAIGNSFYGMQCMKSDNSAVLALLATMAEKVQQSHAELDGQAMGNSLYGLQGMNSEHSEVRAVVSAITTKIQSSCLEMNAQELGNALYGLQNMTSAHPEVRRLMVALTQKVASSKHELTSQEIGNALFGLQGMRSDVPETRHLVRQMAIKIQLSHSLIDPQGVANSLFGMQRMTSDSEEVRMLVQALAVKIEQSWKLLSANHLRNALFGLQGLCSADPEVRLLVNAFVPKIIACRDELAARHVCCILYGLKNMYSVHDEVRALINALTEKIHSCSESFTMKGISAALFGLQGLDSSYPEVRALVVALAEKLASVIDDIDIYSLANSFYGLQRMDTSSSEVRSLLNYLSPMFMALAESGIEISAQVCGNILFGLQGCSCAEDSVRDVLYVILNRIKELIHIYNAGGQAVAGSTTMRGVAEFPDILCVYQALSLALQSLPDLHLDEELRTDLTAQHARLLQIVELRKTEFKNTSVKGPDQRVADAITDILASEPFTTTSGELLFGFEAGTIVRLQSGVNLELTSGESWNPVLSVEVERASNNFPSKELFMRLRDKYFRDQHNVIGRTIAAVVFSGQQVGQMLRELLRADGEILTSLYPPTLDDATNFAKTLFGLGLTGPGGILSSVHTADGQLHQQEPRLHKDGLSTSFFSSSTLDSMTQAGDYADGSDHGVDYFDPRFPVPLRGPTGAGMVTPGGPWRFFAGAFMGWLGEPPVVKASAQGAKPGSDSPSPNNIAGQPGKPAPAGPYAASATVGATPLVPPSRSTPLHGQVDNSGSYSPQGSQDSGTNATSLLSQQSTSSSASSRVPQSLVSYPAGGHRNNQPSPLLGRNVVGGPPAAVPPRKDGASNSGSPVTATAEEGVTGPVVAEVDSEIALLEAQLEIARIEARILMLRKTAKTVPSKGKERSGSAGSSTTQGAESNSTTSQTAVPEDEVSAIDDDGGDGYGDEEDEGNDDVASESGSVKEM